MLTPEHIAHLSNPLSTALGTSDLAMNPHFTRVWGLHPGPAENSICFAVPVPIADLPLRHMRENPQIALSAASQINDYTLQFKGKVTEIRASTPADDAIAEEAIRVLIEYTKAFSAEMAEICKRFVVSPSYVVTLVVEEIYNQTPGKNAGRKLA